MAGRCFASLGFEKGEATVHGDFLSTASRPTPKGQRIHRWQEACTKIHFSNRFRRRGGMRSSERPAAGPAGIQRRSFRTNQTAGNAGKFM